MEDLKQAIFIMFLASGIICLIPVTFMMHNFWTYQDPIESQMQMIHFLKNTALIGGIVFIIFFGAGPYSIDNKRND
jgi:uncharacterized membrane protein YphA (DoxX/SURF4 family)